MRPYISLIAAAEVLFLVTGCGSNPSKTQRPDLLDNKVTSGRVKAALTRAGPDFQHVSVQAAGGDVTLVGNVRSEETKARAEEITRSVDRVTSVDDELRVQP